MSVIANFVKLVAGRRRLDNSGSPSMGCVPYNKLLQCLMVSMSYHLTSVGGQPEWAPTGPFFQLDAEGDSYIEKIQSEYDEGRTFSTTTEKMPASDDNNGYDWNLMAPGEVPFVTILYQPTRSEPAVTEVRPKKACGGILVSPEMIVTPCGCIMSFVAHVIQKHQSVRKMKPVGDFFYDMDAVDRSNNFNHIGVNRIYVAFGQSEFDGSNRDHYLDDNVPDFFAEQECYIRTGPYWLKGKLIKLNARKIDATLAYWRLAPAITRPVPGQFMPWPPKPITGNDPGGKEKVIISGMGFNARQHSFKLLDENGNPTNFLKRGVNLVFEHCHVTSEQCLADLKGSKLACFCTVASAEYQLCGGTIGWPVVSKNNTVVGLTVSKRDCDNTEGSILIAVFFTKLADDVALRASGEKLLEQNSLRPPLYREVPWMKEIALYNYDEGRNPRRQLDHAMSLTPSIPPFILLSIVYSYCW